MQEEMAIARMPLTRGEKGLLVATGALVTIILWLTHWWYSRDATPRVHIPTPAMPAVNAYDDVIAAGKMLKKVPPYAIADAQFCITPEGTYKAAAYGEKPPATPEDIRAIASVNAPALARLRAGLRKPYLQPAVRTFDEGFAHGTDNRNLMRLLLIEGYIQQSKGNRAEKMHAYLDGISLGNKLTHGGPLTTSLNGVLIDYAMRVSAWHAVETLSGQESRVAAKRLETIIADHAPFAEVLQQEQWTGQALLLEVFAQKNWRESMAESFTTSGASGIKRKLEHARYYTISKCEIMENYTRYTDRMIADVKRPYAAKRPAPPLPPDPLSSCLCEPLAQARVKFTLNETYNDLLLAMLALRAYRLAHGAYPPDLAALTPGYITAVPSDPFALKGPLHYRRTGQGYCLYSIGPDGKDNGGTPCSEGQKISGSLKPTSTGDIVAGVNVR